MYCTTFRRLYILAGRKRRQNRQSAEPYNSVQHEHTHITIEINNRIKSTNQKSKNLCCATTEENAFVFWKSFVCFHPKTAWMHACMWVCECVRICCLLRLGIHICASWNGACMFARKQKCVYSSHKTLLQVATDLESMWFWLKFFYTYMHALAQHTHVCLRWVMWMWICVFCRTCTAVLSVNRNISRNWKGVVHGCAWLIRSSSGSSRTECVCVLCSLKYDSHSLTRSCKQTRTRNYSKSRRVHTCERNCRVDAVVR